MVWPYVHVVLVEISVQEHAKELGANAIITMRMDSDSISQNMQEVLAYGTAVVVEKE